MGSGSSRDVPASAYEEQNARLVVINSTTRPLLDRVTNELRDATNRGEAANVFDMLKREVADAWVRKEPKGPVKYRVALVPQPLVFYPIKNKDEAMLHLLCGRGADISISRYFKIHTDYLQAADDYDHKTLPAKPGDHWVALADCAAFVGNKAVMHGSFITRPCSSALPPSRTLRMLGTPRSSSP